MPPIFRASFSGMLELMKEDAVCPQRVTARVLSPHSSCLAQSWYVHHLHPGLNVLHSKSKKVDFSNFGCSK